MKKESNAILDLYEENIPIVLRKYRYTKYVETPPFRQFTIEKLRSKCTNPKRFYKLISRV